MMDRMAHVIICLPEDQQILKVNPNLGKALSRREVKVSSDFVDLQSSRNSTTLMPLFLHLQQESFGLALRDAVRVDECPSSSSIRFAHLIASVTTFVRGFFSAVARSAFFSGSFSLGLSQLLHCRPVAVNLMFSFHLRNIVSIYIKPLLVNFMMYVYVLFTTDIHRIQTNYCTWHSMKCNIKVNLQLFPSGGINREFVVRLDCQV
mmetsp:Transcript_24804/g.55987  ORF Transcript_24804/g.55987 Transcript_24804/m.55987 type:complete len:205 (-) Transcript_24804:201-815(-)